MPATAILDVQGLRRRFGSTEAVAGVDLRVAAGETVALLGPNGAGKVDHARHDPGPAAGDRRTGHHRRPDAAPGRRRRPGGRAAPVWSAAVCRPGRGSASWSSSWPRSTPRRWLPRPCPEAGLVSLAGQGSPAVRWRAAAGLVARPSARTRGCSSSTSRPWVSTSPPGGKLLGDGAVFAADGCAVLFATYYLAEAADAGRVVGLHKGRVAADGTVDEIRRTVATRTAPFARRTPGPGACAHCRWSGRTGRTAM